LLSQLRPVDGSEVENKWEREVSNVGLVTGQICFVLLPLLYLHSGPQCRLNPDFPRGRRGCLSSVLFTPGNPLFTHCICRQPACEVLLIKREPTRLERFRRVNSIL
jgi:hypothetical protein